MKNIKRTLSLVLSLSLVILLYNNLIIANIPEEEQIMTNTVTEDVDTDKNKLTKRKNNRY